MRSTEFERENMLHPFIKTMSRETENNRNADIILIAQSFDNYLNIEKV